MNGLAKAERQFDRQLPPEPIVLEDGEPMPTRQLTDEQIEAWIGEFAVSGEIEDEFGIFKTHYGTVMHAVAQQWVIDKSKLSDGIGNSFWRYAKACARLSSRAFGINHD